MSWIQFVHRVDNTEIPLYRDSLHNVLGTTCGRVKIPEMTRLYGQLAKPCGSYPIGSDSTTLRWTRALAAMNGGFATPL